MNNKFKKGVSLYFVVITILLMFSSVLVLGNIIYVRIKMIKDKGDSVTAFFAADSGVQRYLYYKQTDSERSETDEKIFPEDRALWPDLINGERSCFDMAGNGFTPVKWADAQHCYRVRYEPKSGDAVRDRIIVSGKYNNVNRGIMVRW